MVDGHKIAGIELCLNGTDESPRAKSKEEKEGNDPMIEEMEIAWTSIALFIPEVHRFLLFLSFYFRTLCE